MNRDYFVELYDYTAWANWRVLDCVMNISQEDYEKPLTFSIGAIHVQCVHTMGVEYWWLNFMRTGEVDFLSNDIREQCKDRTILRQKWQEITKTNQAYVAMLTDEELKRIVRPPFWDDDDPTGVTIAQALAQVVNHSTDHRAQIMAMLHTLGGDGVGQDFLTYLRVK